ncbi:MAG: FAD-dependent oxidoreductase [Dehalococcoidales bacterium]|nr:FAD-dependent oxidoreductase [Dehalococcoidales bacterium]
MEGQLSHDKRVYLEPAQEVKVCCEADVVVAGGGPGGHSAAIAAARSGARVVLLDRYGHLGGMATGGIVIQIPHMSDGGNTPQIAGLCQEWLDRLDVIGGSLHPAREDLGSTDSSLVARWKRFMGNVNAGRIEHTAWVDPELLKCVLNDMVREEGVTLYLHSWCTRALVEDGQMKGVIFESKSGRQAVLGKVIIDGTGDGDLLPSAGAEFDGTLDPAIRSSMLALVFRLGKCDYQKLCDFKEAEPERYEELMNGLAEAAGTRLLPLPSPRNDVIWVNNWIPGLDCTKVEDLTKLEVEMRQIMRRGHDFMKKNIPTFENSFILDTASQTGTRGSRRLAGEYIIKPQDLDSNQAHEDTVAIFPRLGASGGGRFVYFPYRSLVPVRVEGLLVAGRSFSSLVNANNMLNLIPHCIAMGQAAGTAAALALSRGTSLRKVDYRELQRRLKEQGVPLPDMNQLTSDHSV